MIGFDTNLLVRLLVDDDEAQTALVRQVLEPINHIPGAVFINDLVLAETFWVLKTCYGMEKPALTGIVDLLLSVKTFAFEDRAMLEEANAAFRDGKAGFADCLILARNRRQGCTATLTFDALARHEDAQRVSRKQHTGE
jgi:predicted nucleic-acid-binding protein